MLVFSYSMLVFFNSIYIYIIVYVLLSEAEGCREGWFPGNIRVIGMS